MGSDSPTRGIYCCSIRSCNLTIDGEMIPMDDELAMLSWLGSPERVLLPRCSYQCSLRQIARFEDVFPMIG